MILVLGSTGFLGRRVCKRLDQEGRGYFGASLSLGVDLRDAAQTKKLFENLRPSQVINCAAFVGGIQYGYKYPAELFRHNLLMVINILECAQKFRIKRVVNPIANCAYPAKAEIFRENEFWDGPLHESVLAYGMSRKMSWVGAWAYAREYGLDVMNLILPNMYGPGDHFEEERSHALGALIMKIATAHVRGEREVVVWGTGAPVREWLHVDDGATAMVRGLAAESTVSPVNVGVGKGITIRELAALIAQIVGYKGSLRFDITKPDGAPFKTMDGTRGEQVLGWRPRVSLREGIAATVKWYMEQAIDIGDRV